MSSDSSDEWSSDSYMDSSSSSISTYSSTSKNSSKGTKTETESHRGSSVNLRNSFSRLSVVLSGNLWHMMTPMEVAHLFGYSMDGRNPRAASGLNDKQVKEKHDNGEVNKITAMQRKNKFIVLLKMFADPFMVLLFVAGIICFLVYGIDPGHDKINLYIGILLMILVLATTLFTYLQSQLNDNVMGTFDKMMAASATVIRNSEVVTVPATEVVRGDLIMLRAGEKCPADVRLVLVEGLRTDNSAMTGESEPVLNTVDSTSEVAAHSRNMAWNSSLIVEGAAVGIVTEIGNETIIGRVARLAGQTKESQSLLHKEIIRFVIFASSTSVFFAVLIIILGSVRHFATIPVIVAAIAILNGNIPQGLPPAVQSVLAITAKVLQTKNVFVKQLDIVETLGSCTVIASDKTGTLTQNKMTVVNLWSTVHPESTIETASDDLGGSALVRVLTLCNRITVPATVKDLTGMEFPADASEIGLFKKAFSFPHYHELRDKFPKVTEIPFNSSHKWQLSVHSVPSGEHTHGLASGEQFLLVMKGAPEIILRLCDKYHSRNDRIMDKSSHVIDSVMAKINEFASQGERVLAVADAYVTAAEKAIIEDTQELPPSLLGRLCFVGLATLLDPPKEGVADAVLDCMTAGIKVIMVTGDFPVTAAAIARKVNILLEKDDGDQAVMTGGELDALNDDSWDAVLSKKRIVFARLQPEHKLKIVERLQKRGEIVAVTGDGVNDSPALKRADVGVAMGIAGTEVAKEAAKIICADDNFASIVVGIKYGRLIFDNLMKIVLYVVAHLPIELFPSLLQYIFDMPLPLSPLLLLMLEVTDLLPSIAISFESPEGDVMKLPPRDLKKDRMVNGWTLFHSYIYVGFTEVLLNLCLYFHLLLVFYKFPTSVLSNQSKYFFDGAEDLTCTDGTVYNGRQQLHILREVQTMWFAAGAMMQLAHGVAIRGLRKPTWSLPKNLPLFTSVFISLLIIIVIIYVPGIKIIFVSRPFPPGYWIGAILASLVIFIMVEVKKAVSFCTKKK